MHMPTKTAELFTYAMRRYLGPSAPAVDVKSLNIHVWLRRRKVHLLLTVEGFGFGNPPNFPHRYFAACEEISFHAAISYSDLWGTVKYFFAQIRTGLEPPPPWTWSPALYNIPTKFPWDPTAYEKNTKCKVHWRDYYVGVLHVYHLIFVGAMCNFEIGPGGELSVNGIERTLAESFCAKVRAGRMHERQRRE
jgi:hypothetical protein